MSETLILHRINVLASITSEFIGTHQLCFYASSLVLLTDFKAEVVGKNQISLKAQV